MSEFVELFKHSVQPYNLPYTAMFGLLMVYWVFYLFTGADFDIGADADVDLDIGGPDLDVGADVDMDMDVDADLDVGGDVDTSVTHNGGNIAEAAFAFVHGGSVPMMIILSVMIISTWVCAIMGTHWFPFLRGYWAILFALPNILIAAILTKFILWPFVPFLRQLMNDDSAKIKIIGKTCIVKSIEIKNGVGQAEFALDGAPLILTILPKENVVLTKGEEVLIYGKKKDSQIYKVMKIHEDIKS